MLGRGPPPPPLTLGERLFPASSVRVFASSKRPPLPSFDARSCPVWRPALRASHHRHTPFARALPPGPSDNSMESLLLLASPTPQITSVTMSGKGKRRSTTPHQF